MISPSAATRAEREPSLASDLGWGALWLTWQLVRLPVFTLFRVLEPFVRIALSAAALLGVLMAFLFRWLGNPPQFPFWRVLALSLGCALMLAAYQWLMRLLAR
jgi:uncharacterized membrane protein YccC